MGLFKQLHKALYFFYYNYVRSLKSSRYGHWGKGVEIHPPVINTKPENVYLYDNVNIYGYSNLIIGEKGKFIMKKNSGSAQGLTVITANHTLAPTIGKWHKEIYKDTSTDLAKDVIIEEDVWIAANVTLLPGVIVGRGAIVGAGSVCRKSVPPYALVMGNPARVIGFKFTPEEIIQHEKALYPDNERYPMDILQKNYKRYYQNKIKDIAQYLKQ